MAHGAPSSSITDNWSFDVFVNYYDLDASSFFRHLYPSLLEKGLRVSSNYAVIPKGEEITNPHVNSLRKSRIAIIFFSKNYAYSRLCLGELVRILECFKKEDKLIYPVFYDVDPSEVRHQTGNYAKAFSGLEERYGVKRDQIEEWRRALSQAADLSGYHFLPKTTDAHECIRAVVEQVTSWIKKKREGEEEEHDDHKKKEEEEEHDDNEKEEEEEEEDDKVMPLGTLSSSITDKGPYHVFLSYCVEDRFYFTDLLRFCLHGEEHLVFVREGIRPDEDITSTLFKAIHESRIAIIVFSKKYANSETCLQELLQILESFKEEGRWIFPVYYDVDPSEAWARLEERFKDKRDQVEKWRLALSQDYHSLTKTTDIREGVRAIVE
ncbi:hypothetical protein QN277_024999 [Acacia crassicarpa]|uniref:ADP-ribosyl cyclase/cyclic ADP-ribose hydrolase n=1 Tax=Acacia crassicarpa TaxID=499986 RepID=A0AAE1K8K5_9FABA|nr:hypothetical protein QN277_024999 [Acacia crassicarpa]